MLGQNPAITGITSRLVEYCNNIQLGKQCKSTTIHTEMVATISNLMHEKLIASMKSNPRPMSLIVDTSTDKANHHQLVVLFYTLENEVPVTYLYGLLRLGTDQTAEAQTERLIQELKKDDLYEHVRSNIIGFVSDGAR